MKKLVVILFAVLLSGCATMLSGTTQNIEIEAVNDSTHEVIADASCTVQDGKGRTYTVDSNPGTILVTKGQGALSVDCKKAGFKKKHVAVGESFNAMTVANVIFWPGAIVDAATGAIQKYPSKITVVMEPIKHG